MSEQEINFLEYLCFLILLYLTNYNFAISSDGMCQIDEVKTKVTCI